MKNIVIKIFWVISVFLFVQSYDDIIILVSLNALSSLLTAVIGIIAVRINFKIEFKIPSLGEIKYQFTDSWHYFLSQAFHLWGK